jgi:hypothetical protein
MVMAVDPEGTAMLPGNANLRLDGTFEMTGVMGKRLLRAGGFPRGWHLKSIMHEGRDITDTPIDVISDISGIEIHLTQTAAEITGGVQSTKGTPVSDYVVVLFPPENDRWTFGSRYVHVARPDQNGGFRIAGVPEASYLAVALEYMEPGEETNPEFLEKLKTLGTRVSVTEGEKKTLTLKLSAQ